MSQYEKHINAVEQGIGKMASSAQEKMGEAVDAAKSKMGGQTAE